MKRFPKMALGLLLVTMACGGRSDAPLAANSPGPVLVVERFLQAANANDLDTMIQLFGTAENTIDQLDGRAKAERRMYVLASILRHDDYSIQGQEVVPGRSREAARLFVQLRRGESTVTVPWVVVRKRAGGWIVEQIDVVPLTQGD